MNILKGTVLTQAQSSSPSPDSIKADIKWIIMFSHSLRVQYIILFWASLFFIAQDFPHAMLCANTAI